MRDGWTETDNYLLIDCGEVGSLNGGHGHADALAIEMAVGGRTLLVDAGTYTYHESPEMRDFFRTTIAHNTLMIDEKSQSNRAGNFAGKRKRTRIHSWISEDRFDFFEGFARRLRTAWKLRRRIPRSILFLKNDYWIMRDFVETNGEHDYGLNFHFNTETNPKIEAAENGSLCVGESSTAKHGLRLFTFGDNGNWQRKESWISDCYGKQINAPFFRFVSKGMGAQEFFTFILPMRTVFAKPEVFETPSPADAPLSLNIAIIGIYSFLPTASRLFAPNFSTRIFAFSGRV